MGQARWGLASESSCPGWGPLSLGGWRHLELMGATVLETLAFTLRAQGPTLEVKHRISEANGEKEEDQASRGESSEMGVRVGVKAGLGRGKKGHPESMS